ncbi:MAG: PstS family phosphate ABC transporter substrate-binding protein [Leptolyngbyaceae cyanobacterium bins.302]|nr:PstS family phosphate ABC transporter substrate-binding protein [Leptolyngbyaceae cyanobacterium bins.302]
MQPKPKSLLASLAAVSLVVTACAGNQTSNQGGGTGTASPAATTGASNLSGSVLIDGSSTVFPISEAMAEEFQKVNPNVKVTVGSSGTGGGFKKFCNDETDITGASRPIKPSEVELCKKGNIEYVELPVAFDGLSVMVNPKNNFAQCLTVAELKKIWEPAAQGKIKNWNQVRADFPNQPLALYGAGTDSGTYDYFTNAIVGDEGKSRGDFTASEDDNILVQGIASDVNALGFFGYAYYVQNKDKLKLVAVDGGGGCVEPSPETIQSGAYKPLSRPEFIYVKKKALERPEVEAMARFYVAPENAKLVDEVGYVSLPASIEPKVAARITDRKVGSVFEGKGSTTGVKLEDLL